jgi:hypothetical protein
MDQAYKPHRRDFSEGVLKSKPLASRKYKLTDEKRS